MLLLLDARTRGRRLLVLATARYRALSTHQSGGNAVIKCHEQGFGEHRAARRAKVATLGA
jgi:hypothetical protein